MTPRLTPERLAEIRKEYGGPCPAAWAERAAWFGAAMTVDELLAEIDALRASLHHADVANEAGAKKCIEHLREVAALQATVARLTEALEAIGDRVEHRDQIARDLVEAALAASAPQEDQE